ncbi:uncharacterized protein LOC118462867 [Anopheles albimanus]|uniref:uncharacterized protein LOC118462867 n=1 Tax=Anopheles albimanus TaxID=7167 RepID=UPI00163E509C|nr:uncharacterized protein LOC118462867 [Anopheles albimanus]
MHSMPPFFLVATIATLLAALAYVQADEDGCKIHKHLSSCDNNKLRYSVVVEGRPGEKIVINHDIERIPPTTKRPRSYIVRGPNPILSKAAAARKARLEKLRADWKARRAAFKEKTNELLANRRARLRNMRPPPAV